MPLSKKRDRERKRQSNVTGLESNSNSNLIQPRESYPITLKVQNVSKPGPKPIDTKQEKPFDSTQDKLTELRKLIERPAMMMPEADKVESTITVSSSRPPIYNPKKHKEGDLVRKWVNGAWLTLVVPELDEMGNVLEEM